jgi:hypothetical protein
MHCNIRKKQIVPGSTWIPAVQIQTEFVARIGHAGPTQSVDMPKRPKKIWYVSFDPDPKRRRFRSAQSFASESDAKQFAREALASGKVVYAGTINPHEPRRFIPPEKIEAWLNGRHEHNP